MSELLEEHLLQSPRVCSSCFGLRLVQRPEPPERIRTRGLTASPYERHRQDTTLEYAPADRVSEEKGLFCECGTENHRTRTWDDADVDDVRFKEMIQRVLRVCDRLEVDVDRETMAATALHARRTGATVYEALGRGLEVGNRATIGQDDEPTSVSAD